MRGLSGGIPQGDVAAGTVYTVRGEYEPLTYELMRSLSETLGAYVREMDDISRQYPSRAASVARSNVRDSADRLQKYEKMPPEQFLAQVDSTKREGRLALDSAVSDYNDGRKAAAAHIQQVSPKVKVEGKDVPLTPEMVLELYDTLVAKELNAKEALAGAPEKQVKETLQFMGIVTESLESEYSAHDPIVLEREFAMKNTYGREHMAKLFSQGLEYSMAYDQLKQGAAKDTTGTDIAILPTTVAADKQKQKVGFYLIAASVIGVAAALYMSRSASPSGGTRGVGSLERGPTPTRRPVRPRLTAI